MTNTSDLTLTLGRDGVALCNCGCEAPRNKGDFLPGHDAKLKSKLATCLADGGKVTLILDNGTTKKMDVLDYADTRTGWRTKVENQSVKIGRERDKATAREANKPIGKQGRTGSSNVTYETLKAAVRVIRACGLHKKALGDAYEDFLTDENAAEIAAGTHERVASLIQRHKSGLFVGQTVAAPEGGYRVAVIEKIERGKVTMTTEIIGGGGATHVVPVDQVQVERTTPDVPAGVPATQQEDAA